MTNIKLHQTDNYILPANEILCGPSASPAGLPWLLRSLGLHALLLPSCNFVPSGAQSLSGELQSYLRHVGDNLAEWLRLLTWKQKVPGSSPGSNIWCSCLNLQRGGAVAMVTELAPKKLRKHRK